ncbi:aldo/keto reductase [Streptomyces avermitilis]|uniref:aldo/keto reductase n=1 Tax=Streptomyces avermitilis TaxID=33903 RepID=UPI0038259D2C
MALAWVRSRAETISTIIGARTVKQLDANLASLDVIVPDEQLAELEALTKPELDFPADFVIETAIPWQQGGTTINGVPSKPYSRP